MMYYTAGLFRLVYVNFFTWVNYVSQTTVTVLIPMKQERAKSLRIIFQIDFIKKL